MSNKHPLSRDRHHWLTKKYTGGGGNQKKPCRDAVYWAYWVADSREARHDKK